MPGLFSVLLLGEGTPYGHFVCLTEDSQFTNLIQPGEGFATPPYLETPIPTVIGILRLGPRHDKTDAQP